MKKLILSMMAFTAIATANAEELNAKVENKKETTVEVAAPVEAPAPETDTTEKNNWGAKLKASPFGLGLDLQTKYMWRGMEMKIGRASCRERV